MHLRIIPICCPFLKNPWPPQFKHPVTPLGSRKNSPTAACAPPLNANWFTTSSSPSATTPTADEVFARVKPELPGISLATVYNCLETLVQCDLVRAVNFERGPTRYCPNLRPHAHFHDEVTGQTHDVDLPETLFAKLKSELPPGFDANAVEITFRGKAQSSAN